MCALSKFVICHLGWEELWHSCCVNKWGAGLKVASQWFLSCLPSFCFAYETEMEKKAWSQMWCKHVNSMNCNFAMELFKKGYHIFLSAFRKCVIRLQIRYMLFSTIFLVSLFLFCPQNCDLLGFIPGRNQQQLSNSHLQGLYWLIKKNLLGEFECSNMWKWEI